MDKSWSIEAEQIRKTYGSGNTAVRALRETSLRIKRGQFAAILGPSGCGKSTLLHVLGGIDEPDSGRVWVDGRELYRMKKGERSIFRRRQIGMVYQSIYLLPSLNVEENIALPLLLDGKPLSTQRLQELLAVTGLTKKREALPCHLSGGQQQRTAIARAAAPSPAVILADEPTGNLDSRNRDAIMGLFRRLNTRQHTTIIMVTHDEALAKQCDRVLYMEDGRILRDTLLRKEEK
ncbi:ABC transporter ATP-binding protein [Faecalicatena contorta]|uniref:ABC transporter ATP-binding protein n=1 Tax=Faecalicatena contorta TaxID=39482 RepID=UPI00195F318B|nr:ABC transporter ATP-binding protein [Faecalicatena contorta]MBM6684139.1 ABC transporter ATP-binding protein [Faecalicatena contorta]MBM6709549.1 ABC transporter ATP-binding protein [Faecalicatena contorta]